MRRVWAGFCLVIVVALGGCGGGGEMSLTEYVDRLNVVMNRALQQGEALVAGPPGAVLVAEGTQFTNFTPQDLQIALDRAGEIEVEVREATAAIEPPQEVAALHNLLFDARWAEAREALAARAGRATSWEELSETPEMEAYRIVVAVDKQACIDFQASLDATEERGVFGDNSWLPNELKEVVNAVLGCGTWPENPEDLYRPPTAAP